MKQPARVVIVGAGFGGLRAARKLADQPVEVVLVDRVNYHLFQPLLYQVATAGLEPEHIAHPVRAILRGQQNLSFRMATVTKVDLARQCVHTSNGKLAYDFLILAVGAAVETFQLPGVEAHAFTLKDLEDAIALRNQILMCFEAALDEPRAEERRRLLSFLIVGAGPTGVEFTGALLELIYNVLSRDYPGLDMGEASVTLMDAQAQVLPGMPTKLSEKAADILSSKGADLRLGAQLQRYDGSRAALTNGEEIYAATLIWAAGVRAAADDEFIRAERGPQGRIRVTQALQVADHPEVYVVGDAAYSEHEAGPLPMMAPVALQMAECAVGNIRRTLHGEGAEPFAYKDPGSLATIGRNAAVASLRGVHFSGFVAWVLWLLVHLVQLISFRNRLLVLFSWAREYLLYDRAVRLIVGVGARRSRAQMDRERR